MAMRTAPTASGAAPAGPSARAVPVVPHISAAMSTIATARPCCTTGSLESGRALGRARHLDAPTAYRTRVPRAGRRPHPRLVHDRPHRVGGHRWPHGRDGRAALLVLVAS